MSVSEDLINFDIIETQKENIQALPQGRSAKALASAFGATSYSSIPTPGATRTLNDTFRAEYEAELQTIDDSDDPLDIYDRYVKWTFNAYPTAQATPESQLRPLLERATRAFQSTPTYKNDPRYLKLWIHYIRLFSDAPREIFAYLARHNIGDGLALYYEEFAAWLEGAGRWNQAEEIYKLGIEREARPSERLLRKFGEFQKRYEARPSNGDEPSSPALPTIRPALAAKLDPYAAVPRTEDPQAQRLPSATTTSRSGKQKIAIFSDADGSLAGKTEGSETSKGWDNIGSIKDRKKENVIEAKPWAGETLKAGKRVGTVPKMAIFRDQTESEINANVHGSMQQLSASPLISLQESENPKTGKLERIKSLLINIYPNAEDEFCFGEIMARQRGWSARDWSKEKHIKSKPALSTSHETNQASETSDLTRDLSEQDYTSTPNLTDTIISDSTRDVSGDSRSSKPRRKKIMEVKGETQTVKLNLSSPSTQKKVRRKSTAEPTMTLHSRAATNDVLDMFNQTLRNVGSITDEPEARDDSDYDDDDYTSGGDSTYTGTGRISGPGSDVGDVTEALDATSHDLQGDATETRDIEAWTERVDDDTSLRPAPIDTSVARLDEEIKTPGSPVNHDSEERFISSPPSGFQIPTRPYRDPEQVNQNRLPFMTPIVEMTESSIGMPSTRRPGDYFSTKTPSRRRNDVDSTIPELEDLLIDEKTTDFEQLSRVEEEPQDEHLIELGQSKFCEEDSDGVENDRSVYAPIEGLKKLSIYNDENAITAEDVPKNDPIPQIPEQSSILDEDITKENIQARALLSDIAKLERDVVVFDDHVNPVLEEMRQKILSTLSPPLSSYPGYHDHRPEKSTIKTELDRLAKGGVKKVKNTTEKAANSESEPLLQLSATERVTVKQLLGRGGWASVFLAETEAAGQTDIQAMKSEFDPSAWEFSMMVLARARLEHWSRSNSKRSCTSVGKPTSFHSYSDAGYMFESFHEQGNLLELVNKVKADALPAGSTSGASNPGVDEHLAMFFAIEIMRTVSDLHSVGLLHCDIKADNFMVRLPMTDKSVDDWSSTYSADGQNGWSTKGIALIDFGRAIDTLAFKPDTCYYAEWATDKHDCPEQREARPWTYQADLWGVASIISVLLFGKVLEETTVTETTTSISANLPLNSSSSTNNKRYKPRDTFKRYWQAELWTEVFDVLMNPAQHATQSERVGRGTGGIKGLPATKLKAVREKLEEFLVENAERKGLKQTLKKLEEKLGSTAVRRK